MKRAAKKGSRPPVIDPYIPHSGNFGYRVSRYDLDLDYKMASNRLSGTATVTAVTLASLRTFTIDISDALSVSKVTVNGKDMSAYFARPVLQMILRQPFTVAGVVDQFDVMATVTGGGLSGQAGAVKHGVSKALQLYDPSLRAALKAAGFLTRDSRVVERKKFGRAKARRSFQFSKR